jgi:hypothetical protein
VKKKKPAKPRRSLVNSKEGKAKTALAVLQGHPQPPAHIKVLKKHLPYWNNIVKARPIQLWTDSDLEMAAHLCIIKFELVRQQNIICKEGYVLERDNGSKYANPRHEVIEKLARRAIALSRVLHVHAQSAVGRHDDLGRYRDEEKEMAETLKNEYGDIPGLDPDLIPTGAIAN